MNDAAARLPAAAIAYARRYPFAIPRASYLYADGAALPLLVAEGTSCRDYRVQAADGERPLAAVLAAAGLDCDAVFADRVAVLSLGSNAAPEQLRRKYAGLPPPVMVPVIRATLSGFDVVYSAHITRYGSIPAALQAAPATAVEIFVNLLSTEQLAVMHRSESLGQNYAFSRLRGIELRLDGGRDLAEACFYRSRWGLLDLGEGPLALAAIVARGRRFPALSEGEVLVRVRDRLAPGLELDEFIAQNIIDPDLRLARIRQLSAAARAPAFDYEDLEG
ncbi:MAG TPA: hypothetical protein ENJ19_04385 [Gammaproteobacteria bacterium]|nr:hypothetical protein [Gammaproteobacteria bacterium]